MKHTQVVIKHLQSNKKYYYYFALFFLITGVLILIHIYATRVKTIGDLPAVPLSNSEISRITGRSVATLSQMTNAEIKELQIINPIKYRDVNKMSDCPDYWELDYSNNGTLNKGICNNVHHLGSCKNDNGDIIDKMDFNTYLNTPEYSIHNNLHNLKKKCKWAKSCNLTWNSVDSICS